MVQGGEGMINEEVQRLLCLARPDDEASLEALGHALNRQGFGGEVAEVGALLLDLEKEYGPISIDREFYLTSRNPEGDWVGCIYSKHHRGKLRKPSVVLLLRAMLGE